MKKKIIFLVFLTTISTFSQWKSAGNADKIIAHSSNIVDFVFSEDNKYFYTIDSSAIIKKWDYSSGDSIWSKRVRPDTNKQHWERWVFFSSDAKRYCTINNKDYIYEIRIYDIETDELFDTVSVKCLISWYNRNDYITTNILNFDSNNILINIGYVRKQNASGISDWNTIGVTFSLVKPDTNWLAKVLARGIISVSIINKDHNRFFLKYDSSNYHVFIGDYFGDRGHHEISSGAEVCGYYDLKEDSLIVISNYQYFRHNFNHRNKKDIKIGTNNYIESGFFDDNNENLFLLDQVYIKKFDLENYNIDTPDSLTAFESKGKIRICNTTLNNYFFVLNYNALYLYKFDGYRFLNKYIIDSLSSIALYKNSLDSKYIYLTDNRGGLYRVNYENLFNATNINSFSNNLSLSISPIPASEFIEVSVGASSKAALIDNVNIFDVFGQNCDLTPALSPSGEGARIDVSGLVPGMYFVRIGDKVGKFLKF